MDHARRTHIRAHHSATHLLHEALRRRLGTHVAQKGSLNAPDRLRFDVSHPRPITGEDIAVVEAEVNARIRENAEVMTRLMTPEAAVEMGAMALFGEKYGEEVRVVMMGGAGGQQAGLVDRAVRRHACPAHRRYRLFPRGRRERGGRRRAPDRGGDRRRSPRRWWPETQRRLNEAAGALRAAPADVPARLEALVESEPPAGATDRRAAEETGHRRRRGRGGAGERGRRCPPATWGTCRRAS